ncbi:MAG TPA: glycoside hydrolase domain-containing protein, partial [Armatimonadota bacterium]
MKILASVMLFLALTPCAFAQNLSPALDKWLPSGTVGSDTTAKDRLLSCQGTGTETIVGLRGTGVNGLSWWRSPGVKLKPGSIYVFRFIYKGRGTGIALSRLDDNVLDEGLHPEDKWNTSSSVFVTPQTEAEHVFRLDQWDFIGNVYYSRPELHPAQAVYRQLGGGLVLGEGERLSSSGEYIDNAGLGSSHIPVRRSLYSHRAHFNGDRWSLSGENSEVIYHHELPVNMLNARLSIGLGYYAGGKLVVSASKDGTNWTPLLEIAQLGRSEFGIPADLLPAKSIYIRFKTEGGSTSVHVDHYSFRAQTDYKGPAVGGATSFVEEISSPPALSASWESSGSSWKARLTNHSPSKRTLKVVRAVDGKRISTDILTLPANGANQLLVQRPGMMGTHYVETTLLQDGTVLYSARIDIGTPAVSQSGYGYSLQSGSPALQAWWCEGPWRVGADVSAPTQPSKGIRIEAARGEFEPVQIVLNPQSEGTVLEKVTLSDLAGKKGRIPSSRISLYEVATVPIDTPSDSLGEPGDCPDPLPPLKTPFRLRTKQNQAIWMLLHVPENTPGGEYSGKITLLTNHGLVTSALTVRVFDFKLPKESHLKTAWGLSAYRVFPYHNAKTPEEKRAVWDKYMQNFAEHRISPYSFSPLDPIAVKFEEKDGRKSVKVDFEAFDREAARYLEGLKFNTFVLPVEGLGWRSGAKFFDGSFGGYKAGTPEYDELMDSYLKQLQEHLRQKGWLDKAFIYWFDEPEPKDYAIVVEGMDRLKMHAPGLRRMLTEQPEPQLVGYVNIWCANLPCWNAASYAERRKAGDEMWWYIACTRTPYLGECTEHP